MCQSDKIQSIILSRENLSAQLTRFKKFIDQVIQNNNLISGLKIRIDTIRPILNIYEDYHISLIKLDPDNKESYLF